MSVSNKKAVACARRLSILKFFPYGEVGLTEVARYLMTICVDDEAADRLVDKALRNCDEWPGPRSLRTGDFGEIEYPRWNPEWLTERI